MEIEEDMEVEIEEDMVVEVEVGTVAGQVVAALTVEEEETGVAVEEGLFQATPETDLLTPLVAPLSRPLQRAPGGPCNL